MAYVVKRNVPSLGLKVGDTLKHKQGQLPVALKFDAEWMEPETEAPKEKKASKK